MSRRKRRHKLIAVVIGHAAAVVVPALPADPPPVPDAPVGVVDYTASWPDVPPPVVIEQEFPPVFDLP